MASLTIPQLKPETQTTPAPFSRLVRVELRKSWDSRASFWLLMTIGILVFLAELITTLVTGIQNQDISWGDFSAVAGFITSVLLPVLGIMLVTSEWGQRTAMVTFALEPRRPHVIAAKAVVGVILTLITVALAVVLGAVCNLLYWALAGRADWNLGAGGLFGFLVTQILAMLGGFALACLFLNTAGSIVAFFAYKWMVPALFGIGGELMNWFSNVADWIDFQNAQSPFFDGWDFSGTQVAQLFVSGALWLGLPLLFGLNRILRAEVK